jgi:simple sugar transport system ATP-binding protein
VLAPKEADALLSRVRRLAHDQGVAVAIVTHHLDEVVRFADEVTVLRRGRFVAHHGAGDPTLRDARALALEALGEAPPVVARVVEPTDRVRLRLRGLCAAAPEGAGAALAPLDLEVRAGEIVGVAGVEGNGQTPLELALAGVLPSEGEVTVDGAPLAGDVAARRAAGLAWIPADRHAHGLPFGLPAADALVLGAMPTRRGLVDEAALARRFLAATKDLDLRPADPSWPTGAFSGGNQQKLVVARELARAPAVLLAAQPTRGVDLLVAARIRQGIVDAAAAGAAVLLVSADLEELRTLSDRLLVLRRGRVTELARGADRTAIGEAMLA